MRFEWDATKRRTNLHKHGFDFNDAESVFDGDIVTVEDDRDDYGETRFVTLGLLWGRTVVTVHTESDEEIRVISMRRATKHEERSYFQQIGN